jgi:hypothetical protein
MCKDEPTDSSVTESNRSLTFMQACCDEKTLKVKDQRSRMALFFNMVAMLLYPEWVEHFFLLSLVQDNRRLFS